MTPTEILATATTRLLALARRPNLPPEIVVELRQVMAAQRCAAAAINRATNPRTGGAAEKAKAPRRTR